MVEQETYPRATAPRVDLKTKRQVQTVQVTQVVAPMTPEQELEQLKLYARRMSKSSKAESMAFLQRAGIMDSQGNIKKEYSA